MVGFCPFGFWGINDYIAYSEFSGNKSGFGESCEEFTDGVDLHNEY